MAFDKLWRLYVTGFSAQAIARFDPNGNVLGTFGSGYNCILNPVGRARALALFDHPAPAGPHRAAAGVRRPVRGPSPTASPLEPGMGHLALRGGASDSHDATIRRRRVAEHRV